MQQRRSQKSEQWRVLMQGSGEAQEQGGISDGGPGAQSCQRVLTPTFSRFEPRRTLPGDDSCWLCVAKTPSSVGAVGTADGAVVTVEAVGYRG